MKTAIALLLAFSVSLPLGAVPGRAADMPSAHPAPDEPAPPADYRDDRSTPESLVQSLYNAIDRHEYLRGWSYFSDDSGRPTFDDFAAGYEDTDTVRLKVGEVTSEGAAGSIFSAVPVAIEGTKTDGTNKCLHRLLPHPLRPAGEPGDAAFPAVADHQGHAGAGVGVLQEDGRELP